MLCCMVGSPDDYDDADIWQSTTGVTTTSDWPVVTSSQLLSTVLISNLFIHYALFILQAAKLIC